MKVMSRSRSSTTRVSYQLFIMRRRNFGETRAATSKVRLSIFFFDRKDSAQLVFFGHQTRAAGGRRLFEFLPVHGTENMIPKTAGDSEVCVRILMMNEVMGSQFPILSILEMEVMMHVMKESVTNKPGQQARQETQDVVELQPVGTDNPHDRHHR